MSFHVDRQHACVCLPVHITAVAPITLTHSLGARLSPSAGSALGDHQVQPFAELARLILCTCSLQGHVMCLHLKEAWLQVSVRSASVLLLVC